MKFTSWRTCNPHQGLSNIEIIQGYPSRKPPNMDLVAEREGHLSNASQPFSVHASGIINSVALWDR